MQIKKILILAALAIISCWLLFSEYEIPFWLLIIEKVLGLGMFVFACNLLEGWVQSGDLPWYDEDEDGY